MSNVLFLFWNVDLETPGVHAIQFDDGMGVLDVFLDGEEKLKKFKNMCDYLVGGFKCFLFSPLPGEMIQFDYCNIFRMGWNHQPVIV